MKQGKAGVSGSGSSVKWLSYTGVRGVALMEGDTQVAHMEWHNIAPAPVAVAHSLAGDPLHEMPGYS